MKKKNLKIAREILMDVIAKMDMEAPDRTELMINIYHLLDEDKYDNNVKLLAKKRGTKHV